MSSDLWYSESIYAQWEEPGLPLWIRFQYWVFRKIPDRWHEYRSKRLIHLQGVGMDLREAALKARQPIYSQIKYVGDDLNFTFHTAKDSPWLKQTQIDAINAPHRALAAYAAAVQTTYDYTYWNSMYEDRAQALWEEPVLKLQHQNPDMPFEGPNGGWLPNSRISALPLILGRMSQTANDLAERIYAKKNKDYATADLIRKVIEGGQVQVRDLKDGVMWIYSRAGQ